MTLLLTFEFLHHLLIVVLFLSHPQYNAEWKWRHLFVTEKPDLQFTWSGQAPGTAKQSRERTGGCMLPSFKTHYKVPSPFCVDRQVTSRAVVRPERTEVRAGIRAQHCWSS